MDFYKHWDTNTLIFYLSLAIGISIIIKNAIKLKYCEKNKKYIILYIISFMILLLIACFRVINESIGGTDAHAYIKLFKDAQLVKFDLIKIITLNGKEPIFYNLFYIVRLFTEDYHYMFLIIYSIIVYGLIYFYDRNIKDYKQWVFILLFILPYISSFNIIRNSMAAAIGYIAIAKLKENKNKQYYILSIIATFVHYTGIILIAFGIFNYIANKKIFYKKQLNPIIMIIIIGLEYAIIPIVEMFLKNSGYSTYLNIEYSLLGYLPFILLFIFCRIFNKDLINDLDKDNNLIHYNAYIFNLLLLPLLLPFNGPTRLNIFFDLSRYLIWGYIYSITKKRVKQFKGKGAVLFDFFVIIIILLWITFRIYRTWEAAGIMPYYNELFL